MFIDTKQATQTVARQFRILNDQEIKSAVARAINHTLAKTQTASKREIRSVYRIKAKDLTKAFRRTKAFPQRQYAELIASGRPTPLMAFGARQNRKGVSVNVKGTRKLIRGAFITTLKSGRKGVFARGKYSGSQFQFRTKRIRKTGPDLPIDEIKTLSIPAALGNNAVLHNLSRQMNTDYPGRLAHEMKRIASRL